jgi:hypothetical protein
MKILDLIDKGTIVTHVNFLDNNIWQELLTKKDLFKYMASHQPKSAFHQNRFDAMPVWETNYFDKIEPELNNKIKKHFENLLDIQLSYFYCFVRLTLTSELKESTQFKDSKYGFVHNDSSSLGGLIPFEQSWLGGTAFFEHEYEKVPEIVYGSHPNRLLLFNGKRNHAACHDYRIEKRYYLNCFMDI